MIIIPAIDIQDGKVVRLRKGDFKQKTVYSHDPVEIAQKWKKEGADLIHLVDLDGAKEGRLQNMETIRKILHAMSIHLQVGGGIRSHKEAEDLLQVGVYRLILGTKAVENLDFLKSLLASEASRIIVSIDCHNGIVTTQGWTKQSSITAIDFAKKMASLGVQQLIYTDISRDGMLSGPNFQQLEELIKAISIPVIASGGVTTMDDIKKLLSLAPHGLNGIIIGKALYEGTINLKEAINLTNSRAEI